MPFVLYASQTEQDMSTRSDSSAGMLVLAERCKASGDESAGICDGDSGNYGLQEDCRHGLDVLTDAPDPRGRGKDKWWWWFVRAGVPLERNGPSRPLAEWTRPRSGWCRWSEQVQRRSLLDPMPHSACWAPR